MKTGDGDISCLSFQRNPDLVPLTFEILNGPGNLLGQETKQGDIDDNTREASVRDKVLEEQED